MIIIDPEVIGRPCCGWKVIAVVADDTYDKCWFQANSDNCKWLCSKESFISMDDITIICCS